MALFPGPGRTFPRIPPDLSQFTRGPLHLQSSLKRGLSKIQFQFQSPPTPHPSLVAPFRIKFQLAKTWPACLFQPLLVHCCLLGWAFRHSTESRPLNACCPCAGGTCLPLPPSKSYSFPPGGAFSKPLPMHTCTHTPQI